MIVDAHLHLFERQSAEYPRGVHPLYPPKLRSPAEPFVEVMNRQGVDRRWSFRWTITTSTWQWYSTAIPTAFAASACSTTPTQIPSRRRGAGTASLTSWGCGSVDWDGPMPGGPRTSSGCRCWKHWPSSGWCCGSTARPTSCRCCRWCCARCPSCKSCSTTSASAPWRTRSTNTVDRASRPSCHLRR